MPPVSKKQAGFFRAVESGSITAPGLSPGKAHEMVSGYPTKSLPERAAPKKKARRKADPLPRPKKKGSGIHIKASHEGDLHAALGIAQGESIPADRLAAAKNSSSPHMRKMANFAANARKWHH